MALPGVNFNLNTSGLGTPPTSEDHVSGIVDYIANANLPAGFSTSDRVKKVFSIDQVEALGIAEGDANSGILWYHCNEFFRINPTGELFIGIDDNTAVDLTFFEDVVNFAQGRIRQIGVYNGGTAFSPAHVSTLQGTANTLATQDRPVSVLYAADFQGTTVGALNDLRALLAPRVSVVIGEDGAGAGAALAISEGQSITILGAALGMESKRKVNESIGYVQVSNLVTGTELLTPAFATLATADLVKDHTLSELTATDNLGYIFIREYDGFGGTYIQSGKVAEAETSDFNRRERVRTMDKAVRGIRIAAIPFINSPVLLNDDGTLTRDTIDKFKNISDNVLAEMEKDEEISTGDTLIDANQDVLTSGEIVITVRIVPSVNAETITFNIGFVPQL